MASAAWNDRERIAEAMRAAERASEQRRIHQLEAAARAARHAAEAKERQRAAERAAEESEFQKQLEEALRLSRLEDAAPRREPTKPVPSWVKKGWVKSKKQCKYGAACKFRDDCVFLHPEIRAKPPTKPKPAAPSANECAICFAPHPDHLALACMHLSLCGPCAGTQQACVLCRTPTRFQKIYL